MSDGNQHKGARSELFRFAKENRKGRTSAENLLWQNLRSRKLDGFKFRRQHPVADFVVDFFCHEANLIIEVDGGYHSREEQEGYDKGRTHVLEGHNFKVLRFTNEEVEKHIPKVLKAIKEQLKTPHP